MAHATSGDVSLHYEVDGDGDAVAFVADLGFGAWSWSWQAPAVSGPYRTVVFDSRGTGDSDAPPGAYTMEDLVADLEAVLADAGVRSATIVGAGMGGMVALEYALEYTRARGLVLLGTAATGAPFDADTMAGGPDDVERLLSDEFRETFPEEVERIVAWRREEDAGPDAKEAQAAAVTGFDVSDRLYEVTVPALVLHGSADAIVPASSGEELAERLPRGELQSFEDGSHLFYVEQSRLVNDVLLGVLERE